MRMSRDLIVLSFVSLVVGCGSSTGPGKVAFVSVSPNPVEDADSGSTLTFTATAKAADGTVLRNQKFSWQTSDATVLSLSATSGTSVTATAVKPGDAEITATDADKSGRAQVTVAPVAVAEVQASNFVFSPATVTIHAGQSVKWKDLAGIHDVEFKSAGAPIDISLGSSSGTRTFLAAGTYNYVCGPHEQLGMTGQVVVEP